MNSLTTDRADMDLFDVYRRTFASRDPDELVVWWYCGFVVSRREGVGDIPLTQAETIMVYRTRDLDADTFTIDWTEVGAFRDIATGEPMPGWFNPFNGITTPHPKSFVDGPATFTVRREGEGIAIALVQHNARIDGVTLDVSVNPTTIGLVQTETKTRTFHRPDGSLPPLDGPEATHIDTVLSVWSARTDLGDDKLVNVPSRGFYTSGSKSGEGSGSWAATSVKGIMQKTTVDDRFNPVAWERLQGFYPDFFTGDRINPVWA